MSFAEQTNPPGVTPKPEISTHFSLVYQQLCESYRAVDQLRMTLLGLLPLATGGGVFLLLDKLTAETKPFLLPIGVFGFFVTLGLFFYELHGIKKCGYLIKAGQKMEIKMEIEGQFQRRPHEVAGFIDEPFAACIIYPAVLAVWTYVALIFTMPQAVLATAIVVPLAAMVVFVVGFAVALRLNRAMEHDIKQGKNYKQEPNIPKMLGRDWQESSKSAESSHQKPANT